MLLNTLSIIESTINKQINNKVDITAFLDFFKHYKKGMWIYPGVLKRKFSLSLPEINATETLIFRWAQSRKNA